VIRHLLFAVFVVSCLTALIWPGYAWFGNSIEPIILGLPFSLVWVIGWVGLSFVALLVYHLTAPAERSDP
jgi:hypothetical protein